MNAVLRTARQWVLGHPRELLTFAGLVGLCALSFLLRWDVVTHYRYPPSTDVGGDLYSAQQWLGHPIPGLWIALQPPLYYWLVVIPAVHLWGPFMGPQVYISLVPALLVFPGYLVCRETGATRLPSALGGFGFAMASTMSLMVTWNGSYNATGILFLAVFLYFLIRALDRRRNWDAIAAGICLALVAATHELTFVVGVIILAVAGGVGLLVLESRKRTLRSLVIVLGVAAAAVLPLVPIYWNGLSSFQNGGVGSYGDQLTWALTYFPTFAWGFQGPTQMLIAYLDVAFSALGIVVLWLGKGTRASAVVLSSAWVAGLVVTFLSASNAVRGLYFLTLPAVLVIPAAFERVMRWDPIGRATARTPESERSPPSTPRAIGRPRALDGGPLAAGAMVVAALLLFTYVNATVSVEGMQGSTRYYLALSEDSVAALRWLGSHTNTSDRIMDTTGIQPWIWGLADRLAYAPVPLGLQATTASYSSGRSADYLSLGTSLLGTSHLTVADNAPSPLGVPIVFVNVPGYWQEMLSTQSDLISFNISHAGSSTSRTLLTSSLVGSNLSVLSSGELRAQFSYRWPHSGFGVNQTILVDDSVVRLSWTGWNATIVNTRVWFGLPPPNPAYVAGSPRSDVALTPLVQDEYQMAGSTFLMSIEGGTFHQKVMPNGWAFVWGNASGEILVSFAGLPSVAYLPPFVEDTSSLVRQLGISYFVANPYTDYITYLRLVHHAFSGFAVQQVFTSGKVYVFHLVNTLTPVL